MKPVRNPLNAFGAGVLLGAGMHLYDTFLALAAIPSSARVWVAVIGVICFFFIPVWMFVGGRDKYETGSFGASIARALLWMVGTAAGTLLVSVAFASHAS
jgi:hypothetical protein